MTTASVELPSRIAPLMSAPRGSYRYRCMYGGRGGGKSYAAALMAAVWGYAEPLRILCAREFQVSIAESMFAEIEAAINRHAWLRAHYTVGKQEITGANGTKFFFRGLRRNASSARSLAGIDLCIVEEAEDVPHNSWRELIPSIRAPNSEIWVLWNPRDEHSAVDDLFRRASPDDETGLVEIGWRDNPWFPEVLRGDRVRDQERLDANTYNHVWEGAYLTQSDAQIFRGKWVERDNVVPGTNWSGPYYGMDFGFAQDPTVAVELWIHDGVLYVTREVGRVGLEIDATAELVLGRMPEAAETVVRADSARPDTISHLRRHGLPRIIGAQKGKGSVEDGIAHIRSYKRIVIDSSCRGTINEFRLYSFEVDRYTKEIRRTPVDAHNHYIDAIRYALEPIMRGVGRSQKSITTGQKRARASYR